VFFADSWRKNGSGKVILDAQYCILNGLAQAKRGTSFDDIILSIGSTRRDDPLE
jgi:hypothetical protein